MIILREYFYSTLSLINKSKIKIYPLLTNDDMLILIFCLYLLKVRLLKSLFLAIYTRAIR